MSTKIYNGLIFRNQDLTSVYKKLLELKPIAVKKAGELFIQSAHHQTCYILDEAATSASDNAVMKAENDDLCKLEWKRSEWVMYWMDILNKAQYERTNKYYRIDFVFELALFSYKDHVLAYWICQNNSVGALEMLKEIGAEDYHYQNSSDKPDEITEEEWVEREKAWDVAMPNAPIDTGLIFTLITWKDLDLKLFDLFKAPAEWPEEQTRRQVVAHMMAHHHVDADPECADLPLSKKMGKAKEIKASFESKAVLFDMDSILA